MLFFKFDDDVKTLKQAEVIINIEISNIASNNYYYNGSFIIFVPSFASFPQFDGFVAFAKLGQKAKIIGYQCKFGTNVSYGELPTWMEKAILLRGKAPKRSNDRLDNWEYWSKAQVKELLGLSFEILYPDNDDV